MGIPKKGSRTLLLHGRTYRFNAKEIRTADGSVVMVTVQQEGERPGRVMQFVTAYGTQVSPSVVKLAILSALSRGWVPTGKGAAFKEDEQ